MSFIVRYVFQDIIKQKKRSFVIALGFMIGVATLSAVFTWTDTASRVFASDYFKGSFQIYLEKRRPCSWDTYPSYTSFNMPFEKQKYSIWDTYNFVQNETLVSNVEVVYSTVCLFNTENKSDSYEWYPVTVDPVLTGQVFMVNDYFLSIIRNFLILEGEVTMSGNGVLLSRTLISQINDELGISIKVGSNVSFAVTTRIAHRYREPTLNYWRRIFFENLTIKGIYDWFPQYLLPIKEYSIISGMGRSGIMNSMFMPLSLVNSTVRGLMENVNEDQRAPGPPGLFIQLNADEVSRRGITNLQKEARILAGRIDYSCDNEVAELVDESQMSKFVDAYIQSRTLLLYIMPSIILSTGATIFSSEITFRGRRQETGILRAKGVRSRQLYTIFIIEFLILAFVGAAFGFALGTFVGCLIPAMEGILELNLAVFQKFLTHVSISPYNFLFSLVISGIPSLLYALGKAWSYASKEVARAIAVGEREKIEETSNPMGLWEIKVKGLDIRYFFFAGMVASLVYVRLSINHVSFAGSTNILYILLIGHWLLFVYATALFVSQILPKLSKVFTFGLKTKGVFVNLDFKRQRVFTSIIIIFTLASSVMVFSLVNAEMTQNNTMNQLRYAIGCDFRMTTTNIQPVSFAQNLTEKLSGVVSNAMPVIYTNGRFGGFRPQFIGLDIISYKNMGVWKSADFEQALDSLARYPNGTIVNEFLADALDLKQGSQVEVKLDAASEPNNLTVVGIVRSAPGFGDAYPTSESEERSLGFQEEKDFILVNEVFLANQGINRTRLFFASAKNGTNKMETADMISTMTEVGAVYSPLTYLYEILPYRALYMQGVNSFLIFQFLITIIVGIVILAFFFEYVISERRVEYAVMRAVGATRKDVTALIFTESIEVVLISLVASSLLGATYSMILFDLLLGTFPYRSIVPSTVVVPVAPLAAGFGIVFLSMLLGNYFLAKKAGRTDVARELRNL